MNIGKHIEEIMRKQGKSAAWLATQIPCERIRLSGGFFRILLVGSLFLLQAGKGFLAGFGQEEGTDAPEGFGGTFLLSGGKEPLRLDQEEAVRLLRLLIGGPFAGEGLRQGFLPALGANGTGCAEEYGYDTESQCPGHF